MFSKPNANKIVHDSVAFFNNIDSSQPHMNTITINEATITEAISEISGTSACGPDGMQASFFKNCAKEIVAPLIILFNKFLNEGVIPDVLKRAAILPVFKNGDRSIPANYRPISLTPILMKIFERIARKQIVNFLSQHNIFNPTQHGFREGRSCLSGPLLFLILMSDINKGVSNTKIISFADDTRVYNNIKIVDDCNVLQSDLESVYNWADVNNYLMQVNLIIYLLLVKTILFRPMFMLFRT